MNSDGKNRPMGVTPPPWGVLLNLGGICLQPTETIIGVSDFQEHRCGFKNIDLFFYGVKLKEILFFPLDTCKLLLVPGVSFLPVEGWHEVILNKSLGGTVWG